MRKLALLSKTETKISIKRLRLQKLMVLPNLFSLGNAFFGFCSLVFVAREDFVASAYAILLGGLMDMLDGRIARYTGTSSILGLQLDSLCDAISFCVAPAFLMYFWHMQTLGVIGFIACAFFLLAGILRLARFNITHEDQAIYFLGIPTTIAATTLIIVFLNFQNIIFTHTQSWLLLGLITFLSILMISSIKFPTLKHLKKSWVTIGIIATLASLMIFGCIKVGLIVMGSYFLFALVENIRFFSKKRIF